MTGRLSAGACCRLNAGRIAATGRQPKYVTQNV